MSRGVRVNFMSLASVVMPNLLRKWSDFYWVSLPRLCHITWRTCAGLQDETLWWVVSKFLNLIFLTGNSFTRVENKMLNEKYWSPYILCWIPGQKRVGHYWLVLSGSTHSQSPPSAGRISSGFLSDSLSGRTCKHSRVSSRATLISVMVNVCLMQFLWVRVGALTALSFWPHCTWNLACNTHPWLQR